MGKLLVPHIQSLAQAGEKEAAPKDGAEGGEKEAAPKEDAEGGGK